MNSLSSRLMLSLIVVVLIVSIGAAAKDESEGSAYLGIYCGKQSCYDVLGLKREDFKPSALKKAYYKMSMQHHPDRNNGDDTEFKKITDAYEILRNEEIRNEYHEFVDHPERFYQHYATFMRRRMFGHQESIWSVIFMVISMATVVDYLYQNSKYQNQRAILVADPNVQERVRALRSDKSDNDIATSPPKSSSTLSKRPKKSKKRDIDELDDITDDEINQVVQLDGWKGRSPILLDLLPARMLGWPWSIASFLLWATRWIVLFTIFRQDYGPEEKLYLTRMRLNLSESQWNSLTEHRRENFLARELWDAKKYEAYRRRNRTRGGGGGPDGDFIDE